MGDAPAELIERVQEAAASRRELCIRAGGTKDFYGNTPRGEPLDPRAWSGVVAYEPSELYITARAGTPLADIESELARAGQMLAFEPPHFGDGATLGGCIAAGLAGPRRGAAGYAYGGVRDFVLGARLLDGRGRLLHFGGTVIKNVAGYDVSRVLAGSMGILGLILEVTLKVLPRPASERTLHFAKSERDAIAALNAWGRQPWPVSASLWRDGELWLRLAGSEAAVTQTARLLGGAAVEEGAASALWAGVREQGDPWFASAGTLWRLSVPSTTPALELQGEQTIEWGGALRWLRSDIPVETIREQARQRGGHATLFRGGDRSGGVFAPLAKPVAAIHQRLKDEFDPARVFNPGRLIPEL